MRKGLVTLGVVALVLAVSPSFAEAPLLSCLPDLVVSDLEGNTQTDDNNLFIFQDAIDLDEYVEDADTADDQLRWSFVESTGNTIEINGIGSNPVPTDPDDLLEPGAFNIRASTSLATVENVAWTGSPPAGDGDTTEATIQMYVSDGTTLSSQMMTITTVNTLTNDPLGQGDEVLPATLKTYPFTADEEGWTWFEFGAPFIAPAHAAAGGAITMTEPTTHLEIVFGGWESPRDPATALRPKVGCVMRARYQMTSSQLDENCPGYRMRGQTGHVSQVGGLWEFDFSNADKNSMDQLFYGTMNFMFGLESGLISRIPGASPGQEYTLMVFPRQVPEMLLADDVVTYITCDMLDLESLLDSDSGTLSIESVEVDGIDRPEIGEGTAVAELSFADFSTGWRTEVKALPTGAINQTGLSATAGTDLTIVIASGNEHFEAICEMASTVTLETARTYRLAFTCTSTETPSGDKGPTVRTNLTSERFVWSAIKELAGGALLARLSTTESLMELWLVAPSDIGAGVTEGMVAQFISYQAANPAGGEWPDYRAISGTVVCTQIEAEVFDW